MGAANRLGEAEARAQAIKKDIRDIENTPGFLAGSQELNNAKEAHEKAMDKLSKINQNIGACKENRNKEVKLSEQLSEKIQECKKDYDDVVKKYPGLEESMLEEYKKSLEKSNDSTWQVITEGTVKKLKSELDSTEDDLKNAQLEYLLITGKDINHYKRGAAYIPFYRQEYRELTNVRMEEAANKLEAYKEKLEIAFMHDFLAKLNERIREAKADVRAINQVLKQTPFGNDTYQFVMDPRIDRSEFFRICERLDNFMDNPDLYLKEMQDNEEMNHDVRAYMEKVLDEEDESEYTDYRKYFKYDMRITTRQGAQDVTADLSKKQGSASGGEKQTPYLIILAASLMQCYPKSSCCARIALIDEAFAAMSPERIEQMVQYFEDNGFQVFYATPQGDKSKIIGKYAGTIVGLTESKSGKYTHAVEGLVKEG